MKVLTNATFVAVKSEIRKGKVGLKIWECAIHLPGQAMRFNLLRSALDTPPDIKLALDIIIEGNVGPDRKFIKSVISA